MDLLSTSALERVYTSNFYTNPMYTRYTYDEMELPWRRADGLTNRILETYSWKDCFGAPATINLPKENA